MRIALSSSRHSPRGPCHRGTRWHGDAPRRRERAHGLAGIAGTPLSGGVGTDGRIVAVANEHGDVIGLDAANGERRWSARVSSEVIARRPWRPTSCS